MKAVNKILAIVFGILFFYAALLIFIINAISHNLKSFLNIDAPLVYSILFTTSASCCFYIYASSNSKSPKSSYLASIILAVCVLIILLYWVFYTLNNIGPL